jgi:hypothetical protein
VVVAPAPGDWLRLRGCQLELAAVRGQSMRQRCRRVQ